MADKLMPNLTSNNVGTVAGNVIMTAGLIVSVFAGIHSMITARRTRRSAQSEPAGVHQR